MIRVMVDIETTGTRPGCGVWDIGAQVLTEDGALAFFSTTANPDSVSSSARDEATIQWQQSKNTENWEAAHYSEKTEAQILTEFVEFLMPLLEGAKDSEVEFWSQGSFDYPILEFAMRLHKVPYPWKYRQLRDLRTLSAWYGKRLTKDSKSHSALVDAARQMELLIQLLHLRNDQSGVPPHE